MVESATMHVFHFVVNRCFSSSRSSRRIIFQNNFKYGKNKEFEDLEDVEEIKMPQKLRRSTENTGRERQTAKMFRGSFERAWWNSNKEDYEPNRFRTSQSTGTRKVTGTKNVTDTIPREYSLNKSLDETTNEGWTYRRYSKNKKNKRKVCPQIDVTQDLLGDNEVIFGYHSILLALQARRRTLHRVFYRKEIEENNKINALISKCVLSNTEIYPCDVQTLDRLSDRRPHQGICAIVSRLEAEQLTEDSIDEQSSRLWLLLDRIHDPMNFGAILRSAYFLGVDKIITCSEGSCRLSPVVSKASAGVLEIEPVYAVPDLSAFLRERRSWNIWGAAGSCDDVAPIFDVRHCTIDKPTVLVIGNEGDGIQAELRPLMQKWVQVQSGRKLEPGIDSLNVGAATAILIHSLNSNRTINIEDESISTSRVI